MTEEEFQARKDAYQRYSTASMERDQYGFWTITSDEGPPIAFEG